MARPGGGILFPMHFHAGLKDGSVTRTVRAWKRLQVHVGGRYRLDPTGVLEVVAVEETTVRELVDEDAVRGGFASVAAVKAELKRVLKEEPPPERRVFRVDLAWEPLPDPRLSLAATLPSPEECSELADRLDGMDARSRKGPWTWVSLGLILAFPRVPARALAPRAGFEKLPWKSNVRKLKELGLTYSREVGYEVTPRGLALLDLEGCRHR